MVATRRSAGSVLVSAYHAEVDRAVAAMGAALDAGDDHAAALDILDGGLRGPTASQVIDRTPDSRSEVMAAARQELEDPKLRLPSNAKSRTGLVRILLLHQVDATWWSDIEPYVDQQAVDAAPELLSLPALLKTGELHFRFAEQPEGWFGRGRDYALRRFAPRQRPRVSGMKFLVARAEIIALLNEIAAALKESAPSGTPALWVNSIVRSVEHQQHLSALGYSALLPSSHCLGYGADVEMTWFQGFGAAQTLQEILYDYRDRNVLNVIDEGQAWHLCLNPVQVSSYLDALGTVDPVSE